MCKTNLENLIMRSSQVFIVSFTVYFKTDIKDQQGKSSTWHNIQTCPTVAVGIDLFEYATAPSQLLASNNTLINQNELATSHCFQNIPYQHHFQRSVGSLRRSKIGDSPPCKHLRFNSNTMKDNCHTKNSDVDSMSSSGGSYTAYVSAAANPVANVRMHQLAWMI